MLINSQMAKTATPVGVHFGMANGITTANNSKNGVSEIRTNRLPPKMVRPKLLMDNLARKPILRPLSHTTPIWQVLESWLKRSGPPD